MSHHLAAHGELAGLWDWNLATNRVRFSPRWAAMVGADERSLGNTPDEWFGRIHPDDAGEIRRQIEQRLAGGPSEFDLPHRLRHANGTYRWTSCHGAVVRVMGCHSDVTADNVSDALTGLPNRLLFMDHVARSLDHAMRNPAHHFAVLLIDLGRRSLGDDTSPSTASDPLLAAAARRLETVLRTADDVTGLAHQLGLEVIAEGVETDIQLGHVVALGCEYVQGYYFSKPVDHERAAKLLQSGFAAGADAPPAAARRASAAAFPLRPLLGDALRVAWRARAEAPDLSLEVTHRHAIRGCRGELILTPKGLEYVPETAEDKAKDGFSLSFDQLTSSVSDDQLTIKANGRTYRFKMPDTVGKAEARSRLAELDTRLRASISGGPSR